MHDHILVTSAHPLTDTSTSGDQFYYFCLPISGCCKHYYAAENSSPKRVTLLQMHSTLKRELDMTLINSFLLTPSRILKLTLIYIS